MKKILTLALVAMMGFSIQSFAQSPDNTANNDNNDAVCNCDNPCYRNGDRKTKDRKGRHERRGNRPGKGMRPAACIVDSAVAFQGIELTADQSAAIAKINIETRQAAQAARAERQQAKADNKADKATRKADKAARKADKAQRKADKAVRNTENPRMQARLAYFKKIQNVLNADQYIRFLENTAVSAPRPFGGR